MSDVSEKRFVMYISVRTLCVKHEEGSGYVDEGFLDFEGIESA